MSQGPSFLVTISSGIQDIAALLPLLGTEQCERHVGSALDKGFLYAAATPLSIFGSLGIVKASFATLLTSFSSRRFYGAGWLEDAGFGTTGSISSMVTVLRGTMRYGAEIRLEKLLKEQYIENLALVSEIRLEGHYDDSMSLWEWNRYLVLTSLVASLLSLTPYVYLARDDWSSLLAWLFPAFRSFGSLLCVVAVQLILQRRILRITQSSLLLLQARQICPSSLDEVEDDRKLLVEERLESVAKKLRERVDLAKPTGDKLAQGYLASIEAILSPPRPDWAMRLFRVLLVVGMGMIVVGYIGCFSRVSQSSAKAGPYVWLGMEVFLSLLRIVLWGWDPSLDDNDGGMEMVFDLLPDQRHIFPHITTPYTLQQLTPHGQEFAHWEKAEAESFIVESADHFLAAASLYRGPLPRLELDNTLLFIGIVPDWHGDHGIKLLCVNACREDSKTSSISFFLRRSERAIGLFATYSSRSEAIPSTVAVRVILEDEVTGEPESVAYMDSQTRNRIIEYSFLIFERLFNHTPRGIRRLSWTITFPTIRRQEQHGGNGMDVLCTKSDEEYMRLRQRYDLKGDWCLGRGNMLIGVFRAFSSPLTELGLVFDSTVMEISICLEEHRFIKSTNLSPAVHHLIRLEGVRTMEERIRLESESRSRRLDSITALGLEQTWEFLLRELRSFRHMPFDSQVLSDWENHITRIGLGDIPTVADLFEHRPFNTQLPHGLGIQLLPSFQETDNGNSTPIFLNMVSYLRSSLSRLGHEATMGIPLPGRIPPCDSASPEFVPPYRCVASDALSVLDALGHRLEDVRLLELRGLERFAALNVLDRLVALPPSPSLTTMVIQNVFPQSHELPQRVSSAIKQQKMICVAFAGCIGLHSNLFKDVIDNNRWEWRQQMETNNKPAYRFGVELHTAKKQGDGASYSTYLDVVLLSRNSRIFVMIYTPRAGRIIPILSLRNSKLSNMTVIASLRLSQRVDMPAIRRVERSVSPSHVFEEVRLDGFQVDEPGHYELYISIDRGQYLFKDLRVEFPVTPSTQEILELLPGPFE
ncbi:hypothetical protein V5O48_012630 [Marasmius crinis-equi]|uniref:Uncharacterized protein n=1 Tax=Marasmius crinis-equi TaxID=585013 RepID=A0ABR3F2B8_9AGAR